jgi:hypothetical protein
MNTGIDTKMPSLVEKCYEIISEPKSTTSFLELPLHVQENLFTRLKEENTRLKEENTRLKERDKTLTELETSYPCLDLELHSLCVIETKYEEYYDTYLVPVIEPWKWWVDGANVIRRTLQSTEADVVSWNADNLLRDNDGHFELVERQFGDDPHQSLPEDQECKTPFYKAVSLL